MMPVLFGLALFSAAAGEAPPREGLSRLDAAVDASPEPATAALVDDHGWPAGSIQSQLDRDVTQVPFGKGAIFIPAMTNPLDEPPVSVLRDGQKFSEGTTGQRIIVVPGTYSVSMGSGTGGQHFSIQVSVHELATSVIPASWAGLVVHVVDETFNSVRGSYEIIGVEEREYFGIGFGSDEQAGEPVSTWVLAPGLYKIVRVGETYRARKDFATVRLLPGHLTHLMLVVDAETNEFKGAGEVPQDELFLAGHGRLWTTLVFGGDIAATAHQNVLGTPDGRSYAVRSFVDQRLSAELLNNPLIARLQIEEGQTKAPTQPWAKSQDRAHLDGLYVYRLFPWLGPYARLSVETNLLEGRENFINPTDFAVENRRGAILRQGQAKNSIRLQPAIGLTSFKEGAGLHVRVFKSAFGETTLRLGVGARHRQTRGLIENNDDAATPTVEYETVPSNRQLGVEGTLLAVGRLTRWVLLNLQIDSLVPFDDVRQVVLEVEATLAVKLTNYVSVNYVLRFLRDHSLNESDSLSQDALLRFSIELP